jgi:hypothetical protein
MQADLSPKLAPSVCLSTPTEAFAVYVFFHLPHWSTGVSVQCFKSSGVLFTSPGRSSVSYLLVREWCACAPICSDRVRLVRPSGRIPSRGFVLSPALGAASAVVPTDVARLALVSVDFCRVQQTLSMLT